MRMTTKANGENDAQSELAATIRLAVPVVLVQLGFTTMGLVDTLMVGRISASILAAVALGNLYVFNVSIFGVGTLMALDPIVSQGFGAGDHAGVSRAVQRGLIIAGLISVVTALCLAPAGSVLRALHQPAEIIPDAAGYARISIAGVIPYFSFVVLRQSLQAMHRVAPIVWTMIVANLCNAGLNWVFVYGHLGSPPMGVAGSAIATAISRWVMMLLLLALAWKALEPNLLPLRRESTHWPPIWRMLKLGLPIGAQLGLEVSAFGATGLLMGLFGTVPMAAHQIAITLASFTFMVPVGVATAAAVRGGRAIGRGDDEHAKAAIRAAYVCGVGFMTCTAVAFLSLSHLLAAAFTKDASVAALAAMLLPIAGLFQVFDGAQAVGAGVLRGAGDTTVPLYAMLAAYWIIGVPVSALLGFKTSLGPAGLWWGFVVSLAAVAIVLFLRIRFVFGRGVRPGSIDPYPSP
jgi:MATE family multidrug resistance protein